MVGYNNNGHRFPSQSSSNWINFMHVCESIKPFLSFQKVLMAELGANWCDQLLEFDMKPFAAASIGQVHRGVLKDGRPVAIKIQVRGGLHNLQHFNVPCVG